MLEVQAATRRWKAGIAPWGIHGIATGGGWITVARRRGAGGHSEGHAGYAVRLWATYCMSYCVCKAYGRSLLRPGMGATYYGWLPASHIIHWNVTTMFIKLNELTYAAVRAGMTERMSARSSVITCSLVKIGLIEGKAAAGSGAHCKQDSRKAAQRRSHAAMVSSTGGCSGGMAGAV